MHAARGATVSPFALRGRAFGRGALTLRTLLLGASVLAAGGGCRDVTGSRSLTGSFALRSVAGRPLPHVLASGRTVQGGSDRVELLASTFRFGANGSVRREIALRYVSDVPARDSVRTIVQELAYRRTRVRIEVGGFTP